MWNLKSGVILDSPYQMRFIQCTPEQNNAFCPIIGHRVEAWKSRFVEKFMC